MECCHLGIIGYNRRIRAYYSKVVHRQNLLAEMIPRRAVVHNVLVTTEGLTYNEYSGAFQNVVIIDDLFEK